MQNIESRMGIPQCGDESSGREAGAAIHTGDVPTMKSFLLAIFGASLLVCLPSGVLAQLDQGQIGGVVTDGSHAVVQNATVQVISAAKGTIQSTHTDSNGLYSVTNLPVDVYNVVIESAGFRLYKQTGITVDAGARVTANAVLEPGAAEQTIIVRSTGAEVETDTAMVGRTIDTSQMKDLALNGRNPINMALTKAGVTGGSFNQFNPDDLGANGFTINGSSSTENAVTLDGVNAVRTRSGTATIGVFNVDAIQEVQILAANYPAEYGRVDGGQIRFVSKSGTSDFHGTVFEFFRNSALDANSWVRNDSPDPTQNSKPDGLRFNQPGFSLGGPVYWPGRWNERKDKLFFFAAEEWVRFRQDQTNTGTVPTALMRQGNFSELLDPNNPFTNSVQVVMNPATGQPFGNNTIGDPALLSKNGLALLSAFPLPTPGFQDGAANWIESLPAPRNSRKDFYRVDYYAGRNRYTLTGQHYAYESISPFTSDLDRFGTDQLRPNDTGAFNITSTFSPKWLNDLTVSASNDLVNTKTLQSRPYERNLYGIDYPYIFPGIKDVEDKIPT
ncbi:MAG TPA: carboxypeptidase regulatory-like domain-containing protein, partial [Rhizomicrobium sp.]